MRFGEYIQKLREAKGLSATDAARELGMTPQRLCDIEKGRRNFQREPSLKLLQKIATVYDHPFSNLVQNTEFFQYEKTLISDLLSELEPLTDKLEKKALEMRLEAKQYTPEMEDLATDAHHLTQTLKMALLVAKTKYSRAPRAKTLDGQRTRRSG